MTTPTLRIKITPAPKLRGKMDVRFPANVEALSPIILDKSGGTYTFSLDANALSGTFATAAQGALADTAVQSVVAGSNVTVDNTDPKNPVISATGGGGGGSGDVTGPSSSVDGEIALYNSTTGKVIKRASTTGILKASSGVLSAATAGTDYYNPGGTDVAIADGGTGASTAAGARANLGSTTVGDAVFVAANAAAARTAIGVGTISTQDSSNVSITGGSITGISDLAIADGGTGQSTAAAAFDALAPTTTRGDLIFRNASTNTRLAASTAGYHLQTNGAASDPTYVGFVQSGSSPTTRTWQDKARDFVSIADFGAVGDGNVSNASANATALTNALATGKRVFIPWTSSGYHFGTNTVTVDDGQSILGENGVLLKSTSTGAFLALTPYEVTGFPATIEGVKIDMTGSGASSTAIRFLTASGVCSGAKIKGVTFTNCVEAVGDESHATNYVVDCEMDFRCLYTRGRQVYIRRSRGFMDIDAVRIDHTLNAGTSGTGDTPVTWEGARFEDFIGLEINRFDCVGPVTTTYQSGATGLVLDGAGSGIASVWINRALVDSGSGNGIYLTDINFLEANWLESYGNLGNGIILTRVTYSNLSNVFARGGKGLTGAASSANGFATDTCSYLAIANIVTNYNTGNGISISNTTDCTLSNALSNNNDLYGLYEGGTSNRNIVNSAVFDTNTSGSYALTGAASRVINVLAAGTFSAVAAADVTSGAALTRTNDTNVTVTLGGTPSTSMLKATSLTLGWSGTLAASRGGFGADVSSSSGVPLFATGTPTFTGTTGTGNFVRAASPALSGNPTFSVGGSSNVKFGAASNYNIISLNNVTTLGGSLGIFGGATGDASALYLSAPSSFHFYLGGVDTISFTSTTYAPITDSAMSNGDSSHRWTQVHTNTLNLKSYTVATLPSGSAGMLAFASNLRVYNGAGTLEGAGAGTGGVVSHNGTAWKIIGTNITASA